MLFFAIREVKQKTTFTQTYQKRRTNTMTNTADWKKLQQDIDCFINERKWAGYHSPKNLAMALAVESSELLEIFQWMTQEESLSVSQDTREHIEEEIGDIMIYLSTLSAKFAINPIEAAQKKLIKNGVKYPLS